MARSIDDPVADLKKRARRARSLAVVRPIVRAWWREHELARIPVASSRRIAVALIDQGAMLAGIVVLQQIADRLTTADLADLARLVAGHDLPDAFALTVLATVIRDPHAAHDVVGWRDADASAPRRAACLAFAGAAARGGMFADFPALALSLCATVVWSHEPADQLAVGTLLRRLGPASPGRVEAFVRRYARLMSRPCARLAIRGLPPAQRVDMLAHHKRATTPRGG